MRDILRRVAKLVHMAASQYPGGITAIAEIMRAEDGRALSTIYQDINDKMRRAPDGRMKEPAPKVGDLIRVMELTGKMEPLHAINAHFGMCASGLACAPDAATIEAEMLQDYPALVDFHKAAQAFKEGLVDAEELLNAHSTADREMRETLAKVINTTRGAK